MSNDLWECPGCKWTFQAHDQPHDCAEYNGVRFYTQRIAELERQVLALSHDRDRLCKSVLENPARVALVELVKIAKRDPQLGRDALAAITAAEKALADTEHEVRKP